MPQCLQFHVHKQDRYNYSRQFTCSEHQEMAHKS